MDSGSGALLSPVDAGSAELVMQLQDLLADNADVQEFLAELSRVASVELSLPDNPISCGVTVLRRKKPLTVANSDERSRILDEVQNSYGDGPCLTALRVGAIISVPDVKTETRWPDYMRSTEACDVKSILSVPMDVRNSGKAVLNFYSSRIQGFSDESILAAQSVAEEAARALHLALKIAQLNELTDNLSAALETRTTIATAVGIIMAENRCSREKAFQILVDASSHRNTKMHTLAEGVIGRVAGDHDKAPDFDE
ncbi:GAF domain-containing protein [Arthrobacter tumbae]|nr:GAF and ANTAR domain-containing protein [Arthrobacter tumbae]MBM7780791.1 GAF domain-containing protein [Arthrobacter tumbae]